MANPVISSRTSHQGIVKLDASPDDLVAVSGISRAMAQAIYDFFHERRE